MQIKTEELTPKDISILRWRSARSALITIGVLVAILGVISIATKRADAFNMLGFLSIPAFLMLGFSFFSINGEFKSGKKITYTGRVTSKHTFKSFPNRSTTTTFYVNIEGESVMVNWMAYRKAKEGQFVRISVTEKSRYFLTLEILRAS